MRMYFRFYEPKLIEVNKTRTDSLFVKHKAQIAMMNDEKLTMRDLNVSVQQEMITHYPGCVL